MQVSCVNTMAAGLRYCDRALTVSPSYAVECCTDPEKGVELESLFTLAKCTGPASCINLASRPGILNGVKEGVSPSDKPLGSSGALDLGSAGTSSPRP